jgi:Spy/CpxP family protein refolding chaperone
MDANQNSRKAVVLVILVFVLGIALGIVGTYLVTSRVEAARAEGSRNHTNTLAIFTKDLNLSPEQQQQIEAILRDIRAQYAAIHQNMDPEYEQARKQGRDRIRQILTPDQKPKFEELLRRMDEERLKRQQRRQH